jgi:phage gp36-like protein
VALYIVQSDLENAVGTALLSQLFSDGVGGASATLVTEAMTDAQGDADSILGPDFSVPITGTIPRILKRCCVDMAIFYGYERKPEFRITGGDNPEQKRYDRARMILKDVKKGERDLGDEVSAKSAAQGGVVLGSSTTFIVDPNESSGMTGGF